MTLLTVLLILNLAMSLYHEWVLRNALGFIGQLYRWELERRERPVRPTNQMKGKP